MSGEKGKTGMLEKPVFQEMMKKEDEYVMPVSEIIDKVAAICKRTVSNGWTCLALLPQARQRQGVISILWFMDARTSCVWKKNFRR